MYCKILDLELLEDPVVLLISIVNKININKYLLVGFVVLQLLLFLTLTKQTTVKTDAILIVFILLDIPMNNVCK